MTAYEFIKLKVSNNSPRQAEMYDANVLERLLVYRNSGKDLRKQREYKEAEDAFYDCTMSCDRDEAKECMAYFMGKAIAYGLQTQDTKWGYFFLAAFDIHKRLIGG